MGDKSLVMVFLNELGARVSITLPAARDGVTPLEVSAAMDVIIAKNIFNSTSRIVAMSFCEPRSW